MRQHNFECYMSEQGWSFDPDNAPIGDLIQMASGDCDEFLYEQGYFDGKNWTVQNYPYGRIPFREKVVAWRASGIDDWERNELMYTKGKHIQQKVFPRVLGYKNI